MAIGDKVGDQTIKDFTDLTLPAVQLVLRATIQELIDGLHGVLDRLDGARMTSGVTLELPPRTDKPL
jgi:hypothetical protein